jgi:two-component system, cell cycle sensor histidine kinase and response regulator CckA
MVRIPAKVYAAIYLIAVFLTAVLSVFLQMAEWFFLLILPFFYSVFYYGRVLNYTLLALLTTVTFFISISFSDVPYTSGANTLALALVMICVMESIIWAVKRLRLSALIVEQMTDAVIVTDMTGSIAHVNPAFENMTGYSRREAAGKDLGMLTGGRDMPSPADMLRRVMATRESWRGRLGGRKKEGTLFTAETSISPLRGPAGEVFRYVAVLHDITRELQLEEQFAHAQKMEAIGQLASGVAHDFNNLLQVIQGHVELALYESRPGSAIHKSLVKVMRAAESAAVLVRQLLVLSRKQALQLEVINLGGIVNNLAKLIRRIIGTHITIDIRSASGTQYIRADKGQIEQVLMNLCVNARDAIGENGTLTLETGTAELDAAFCETAGGARPGPHAVLTVADTGCGMDAETQRHIFEPFYTTKEEGEGTGLGLATVYGIVQQHGGMITVASETGTGTTFRIYLPRAEKPENAPEQVEDTLPPGGNETILVADDEKEVRQLTETILSKAGYRVMAAQNGGEAISMLNTHDEEIALAVLDVLMPGSSGIAVFDHIRAHFRNTRVLFVSGYNINALKSGILPDDAADFIMKPYSEAELLWKVRQVLDR